MITNDDIFDASDAYSVINECLFTFILIASAVIIFTEHTAVLAYYLGNLLFGFSKVVQQHT